MEKRNEKQIGTSIDRDVLCEFKKEVLNKYGQLRGVYKRELEIAIKERTERLKEKI